MALSMLVGLPSFMPSTCSPQCPSWVACLLQLGTPCKVWFPCQHPSMHAGALEQTTRCLLQGILLSTSRLRQLPWHTKSALRHGSCASGMHMLLRCICTSGSTPLLLFCCFASLTSHESRLDIFVRLMSRQASHGTYCATVTCKTAVIQTSR